MAEGVAGVVSIEVVKNDPAHQAAKSSVFRIVAKTPEAAAEAKEMLTFMESDFAVPKYASSTCLA